MQLVTNAELDELRGDIFGCKILLFNCISLIADLTDNPAAPRNSAASRP
jgi:hypothetical protein